jgi:hypothetical protein
MGAAGELGLFQLLPEGGAARLELVVGLSILRACKRIPTSGG